MGVSRRNFLKDAGLMVMAGTAFLTTEQWLRGADDADGFRQKFEGAQIPGSSSSGPASEQPKGRDARLETPTIVTIFLRGGCDSLNAFVPFADDGYYKARPRIAI